MNELSELFEILRIPSVSTDPRHTDDVRRCAEKIEAICSGMGFKCTVHKTARHPIVLAE